VQFLGQQADHDLEIVVRPLLAQLHDDALTMLREIGCERRKKCAAERVPQARRMIARVGHDCC
jgi:hypothetical protein